MRYSTIVIFLITGHYTGIAFAADANNSLEQFCEDNQPRVLKLLAALDINRPGMEAVKTAAAKNDLPNACSAILNYYRTAQTAKWLRSAAPTNDAYITPAESILQDHLSAMGYNGKITRLPSGRKDWTSAGPANDVQYNAFLLRQTYFIDLLNAYNAKRDPKYVRYIDSDLKDYLLAISEPPADNNYTPRWGAALEAATRLKNYQAVFFALQDEPALTPQARILLLSAVPDHAAYVVNYGSYTANHAIMEMYCLAMTALCLPEFKEAPAWLAYANTRMEKEYYKQVYPDYVNKELAAGYHYLVLSIFERYNALMRSAGHESLPVLAGACEKMWDYLASVLTPSGNLPINNDSVLADRRDILLDAATRYSRPDWTYIATSGRLGQKPTGIPSRVYPWGHHVIMRSGFDPNAQYAFFDCGPMGIAHQHYDKLNIVCSAFGRELLVDSGIFTYKGYYGSDPWRAYAVSSAAHNVILVDGIGQGKGPLQATKPMSDLQYHIDPNFVYACGSFTDGYRGAYDKQNIVGTAAHTRKVLYLTNKFWIVLDTIHTDRPRKITALWHFHPDCNVVIQNNSVASIDEQKGNLRIVPVSDVNWALSLTKGQTTPAIQGWYSTDFNKNFPCYTALYDANIAKTAIFAWLLLPAQGQVPIPTAQFSADPNSIQLRLTIPNSKPLTVIFPNAPDSKPVIK